MLNFLKFKPPETTLPDAPEEHRIQIPGIEIEFHHTTHTAFMIDGTGTGADPEGGKALRDLELWLKDQGWFLHCVTLSAPLPIEKPAKDKEDNSQ